MSVGPDDKRSPSSAAASARWARWNRRLARREITSQAAKVLGVPVGIAIPVRRHSPRLQMTAFGLEIAAFAAFVLTVSLLALAATVVAAIGLLVLTVTDQHRVLALTSSGVIMMAATSRRVPVAEIASLPVTLALPEPKGLGVPVEIDGVAWWVDAWDFPRLAEARDLQSHRRRGEPDPDASA